MPNPLSLLVLDYLLLVLHARPDDRVDEEPETVGFHPEHAFQRIVWYDLEIDGEVVRRAAVESASERWNVVDEAAFTDIL